MELVGELHALLDSDYLHFFWRMREHRVGFAKTVHWGASPAALQASEAGLPGAESSLLSQCFKGLEEDLQFLHHWKSGSLLWCCSRCSGGDPQLKEPLLRRAGGRSLRYIPVTVTPIPRQQTSLSISTGPVCSLHNFNYV